MNRASFPQRIKIPNVVLVGGTACGKTTVGFQLARLMGFGYLDLDRRLEQEAGKTVAEIFATDGEKHFRELEEGVIQAISSLRNHVIITGAGIVEQPKSWERLKSLGIMIWLATPLENVIARLIMKPDELRNRPLLADAVAVSGKSERAALLRSKLQAMEAERTQRYQEADLVLADGYATPETGAFLLKSMLVEYGGLGGELETLAGRLQ